MEKINVYFESKTHSELIATFNDETCYIICLPALEKQAKLLGMIVTEEVGQWIYKH